MEFRDFAANEASALITRLLEARSENSLHQLRTFRDAVDAAARAAEDALGASPQLDAEVSTLVERLTEAARLKAEAAHEQEASARASLEEDLQEVRGLLEETLTESARLSKELGAATIEKDQLTSALSAAQATLQAAHTQRDSIASLLKASHAHVQTLERAHADDERARRELQARVDAAVEAEAALRGQADEAGLEVANARAEIETLKHEVRECGSLFEELQNGFQSLADAVTIAEVLTTLVEALSTKFSRVALFRVKGNRLAGEYQIGLDFRADITNVAIPLSMDSLLTRAVASGEIESLSPSELSDSNGGAPFGGTPACALALPIVVHGETLAVVYADDSGQGRAPGARELAASFVELLLRHAVALLMRLTTELKALAELREYATMLLNEAEHMYVSDVSNGKRESELQSRLKDNVACARRIYAQRVVLDGPSAAGLFDDHLSAFIDAHSATPFGRDLAVIAGLGDPAIEHAAS